MILWFALYYCEPYFRIKSDPWRMRQGIQLLIVGFILLLLYSLSGFYVLQTQLLFPGTFGGFMNRRNVVPGAPHGRQAQHSQTLISP